MPNSNSTIDQLNIEITASSANATRNINALCKALGNLNSTLGNVNLGNLHDASAQLNNFAIALSGLSRVQKISFAQLKNGVNSLADIRSTDLSNVTMSLNNIIDPISRIGALHFDASGLTAFINSIKNLAMNSSNLAQIDFSVLGNRIVSLANTVSGIGTISADVTSFVKSITRLANAGDRAKITVAALDPLGNEVVALSTKLRGMATLSSDTLKFTQAIAQLATAGNRVDVTANNLGSLATSLYKFFQTMAKAPEVSRNIIDMTNALANLASTSGRVNKSVFRLDGIGKTLKGSFFNLGKATNSLKSNTFSLASAFGKFYATYWLVLRAIRGVGSWVGLSSKLTEIQNVVDVTFGDMSAKVDEFAKDSIKAFGMSELSVKQYASRFQAMGKAMNISASQIKGATTFLSRRTKGFDEEDLSKPYVAMSSSLSDVSLSLTRLTADLASFYDVNQEDVAKALQSGIFAGNTRPLRQYGIDVSNATLKEWAMKNGLDANIKSMTQAQKTMLRYQYVMTNLKDAQGDFARTSGSWANQVRILKQSFEQLGTIIGGVIINVFKPFLRGLNTVLQATITFTKSIADALGGIFGWSLDIQGGNLDDTLGDAIGDTDDLTDSIDENGDSAEDASKKVKKYKDALMGFDKINKLPNDDNNQTDKDKSGSGVDEDSLVSTKLIKNANNLMDQFNSSIKSLYGVGSSIRDALIKTMDKIDWNSIYERARKFGIGLADFLNGLFSNNGSGANIFSKLGETIAGAINTSLNFQDAFTSHFNFKQLGIAIGTGVNSVVNGIDWKLALKVGSQWGKGLADQINGFVQTVDFSEVGSSIANALNTTISYVFSFGDTLDTDAIGTAISDTVNGFFDTFDFAKMRETLDMWADKLVSALGVAIKGIEWGDALSKIFSNIPLKAVTLVLGVLTIKNFGKLVLGKAFSSISSKIISYIMYGMAGPGSAAMVGQATAGIGGLTGLFESIAGALTTALSTVSSFLFSPIGLAIVGAVIGGFLLYKNWDKVKEFAGTVKEKVKDAFSTAGTWLKDTGSQIVASISFTKNEVEKRFQKLKEYWGPRILDVKTKLTTTKNNVASWFSNVRTWWGEKALDVKNYFTTKKYETTGWYRLLEAWWGIKTLSIKNKFDTFKSNVYQWYATIKAWWGERTLSVKTALSTTFDTVSKWWRNIKSWWSSLTSGGLNVNANANMSSYPYRRNADGGMFVGGKWVPVNQYYTGGNPTSGEFFMARENGIPEMVGRIGSHTAVLNNDQIVSSVALGVANAVASVMGSSMNGETNVNITLEGDAGKLFNVIKTENNRRVRATRVAQLLV